MKKVTIKDVARMAGVSVGTASRVMSGHPSTSSMARARVQEAAKSLNFHVNARARSLRKDKTGTVGVVISDVRNPFFADIAHSVEQAALENEAATILCNANEDTTQQDRYLSILLDQRVDGLILTPQGDGTGGVEIARDFGVPMVFVDRVIDGIDIPSVTSDGALGISLAVAHLSELGHRRVGFISGPMQTSTGRERFDNFREDAAQMGFDEDNDLIAEGNYQFDSGVKSGHYLLSIENPPTAILAANAPMALGVVKAARDLGFTIGHDLSLIGYDDSQASQLIDPPMTVVKHDPELMGRLAFEKLRDVMLGYETSSTVTPTELVIRGTTAPPIETRRR